MNFLSTRIVNKQGQHTLEYVILLTLIMAGIIIGGPYAIRSWNAQVKSLDTSARDALLENMTEAPASAVSFPGCDAQPWIPSGCGPISSQPNVCTGAIKTCPAQWQLFLRSYDPLGCQCGLPASTGPYLTEDCRQQGDSSGDPNAFHCCTAWVGNTSGCDPASPGCPVPATDCGANSPPCPTLKCPDGQYCRKHTCDTGYVEMECVPDPTCVFSCVSPAAPPLDTSDSTFCVGSDTGLTGNTNYVLVDSCGTTKCAYDCNDPYVPSGSPPAAYNTKCACPGGLTFVDPLPYPPNYGIQGTCGANQCYRGSCGPNECQDCSNIGGGCILVVTYTVASVVDTSSTGAKTDINDQSAATSALLCTPSIPLISNVFVIGCPTGDPSGATPGTTCGVQAW